MDTDPANQGIQFLQPQKLPGTELMIVHGCRRLWHVYHETYGFCACRTAGAYYRYRAKSHGLTDGSTMLLEPGEVHRNTEVHRDANFKVFFIAPRLFGEMAREMDLPGPPHFPESVTNDPRLCRALYGLSDAIESNDTVLKQQSYFTEFSAALLDYAERRPAQKFTRSEPVAVARAKAYLHANYNKDVTLDALANASGLNRFHLVKAFSQSVGLPPHAYQIHIRIARARALLALGIPQASIAAQLGFSDQSHFIRHFRKVLRVTPGSYIRAKAA
jgi:AraC-like DNA-binding protein